MPTSQEFTKRGCQPFCASSFRILGTSRKFVKDLKSCCIFGEHPRMVVYQMAEGACLVTQKHLGRVLEY